MFLRERYGDGTRWLLPSPQVVSATARGGGFHISPSAVQRIVKRYIEAAEICSADGPVGGLRAGPETHPADRAGVGGAEGDQGSDGVPRRRRRVHLAGGADLQTLWRRVDTGRPDIALPAGLRCVGIGFKTADTIAQAVGIPHDSPQRIKAGLQYTLSEAAMTGTATCPKASFAARRRRSSRSSTR